MIEMFNYVKNSMTYEEYVIRIVLIIIGFIILSANTFFALFLAIYHSKRNGFSKLSNADKEKFLEIAKTEGLSIEKTAKQAIEYCIQKYELKKTVEASEENLQADRVNNETFKVTFLSQDESEFRTIQEAASRMNYVVYPKVRTLELVAPRTHLRSFGIIQKRLETHYVDFVICNNRNRVEAIVLLSKTKPSTQNDHLLCRYAEIALGVHGYRIIRANSVHPDILDCLD